MRGYKIYIDDIRTPKSKDWVIVRTFEEFVETVKQNGIPEEISFDHDLGWDTEKNCERKSGYDCAKWLINNNIIIKKFSVHSANPVGAQNITSLLNNFLRFSSQE
jgi:hypothetical protein